MLVRNFGARRMGRMGSSHLPVSLSTRGKPIWENGWTWPYGANINRAVGPLQEGIVCDTSVVGFVIFEKAHVRAYTEDERAQILQTHFDKPRQGQP